MLRILLLFWKVKKQTKKKQLKIICKSELMSQEGPSFPQAGTAHPQDFLRKNKQMISVIQTRTRLTIAFFFKKP